MRLGRRFFTTIVPVNPAMDFSRRKRSDTGLHCSRTTNGAGWRNCRGRRRAAAAALLSGPRRQTCGTDWFFQQVRRFNFLPLKEGYI